MNIADIDERAEETNAAIQCLLLSPCLLFKALACTTEEQGAVRLQGWFGSSFRLQGTTRGRVEICNANRWGLVCRDFWDKPDARVVCRQLGYASK